MARQDAAGGQGLAWWTSDFPQLVARREAMPNVERHQTSYVRYKRFSEAQVSQSGWDLSTSRRNYEQLARADQHHFLPEDHLLFSDLAPESSSMRIIEAPAEWAVPVKQDRRLAPSFRVRVDVRFRQRVSVPITVRAFVVTQQDKDNILAWNPDDTAEAADKHKKFITELKGTVCITHHFEGAAPVDSNIMRMPSTAGSLVRGTGTSSQHTTTNNPFTPLQHTNSMPGPLSLAGSQQVEQLAMRPTHEHHLLAPETTANMMGMHQQIQQVHSLGLQQVPASRLLADYPQLHAAAGLGGGLGLSFGSNPSSAARNVMMNTWSHEPDLRLMEHFMSNGGISGKPSPAAFLSALAQSVDGSGTLNNNASATGSFGLANGGYPSSNASTASVLPEAPLLRLQSLGSSMSSFPSLSSYGNQYLAQGGASAGSISLPRSNSSCYHGTLNVEAVAAAVAAAATVAPPETYSASHEYEFVNLEFLKPTRMSKVYMVFVCNIMDLDSLFVVYNIPTVGICRAEQREKACQKLGVALIKHTDSLTDSLLQQQQLESPRLMAHLGHGVSDMEVTLSNVRVPSHSSNKIKRTSSSALQPTESMECGSQFGALAVTESQEAALLQALAANGTFSPLSYQPLSRQLVQAQHQHQHQHQHQQVSSMQQQQQQQQQQVQMQNDLLQPFDLQVQQQQQQQQQQQAMATAVAAAAKSHTQQHHLQSAMEQRQQQQVMQQEKAEQTQHHVQREQHHQPAEMQQEPWQESATLQQQFEQRPEPLTCPPPLPPKRREKRHSSESTGGVSKSGAEDAGLRSRAVMRELLLEEYQATGLTRKLSERDLEALLSSAGFPEDASSNSASISSLQWDEFALSYRAVLSLLQQLATVWDLEDPCVISGFDMDRIGTIEALSQEPAGTFICRFSMSQPGCLVLTCKVTQGHPRGDADNLLHAIIRIDDLYERRVDTWIRDFAGATHVLDVYHRKRVDKRKVFASNYMRLRTLDTHALV